MTSPRVLMVLGGSWHDFAQFAQDWAPCLEQAGFGVEVSFELGRLTQLEGGEFSVVLLYTCLDEHTLLVHDEAQIEGLRRWVRQGGGLLGIHSATVFARKHAGLRELLGGVFLSHPPRSQFTVVPMAHAHPVTLGISAFTVDDEFYQSEYDPAVQIHLVGEAGGRMFPLAWSRSEHRGRVVYLALGHDAAVWTLPAYQRLLLQSLGWLMTPSA